jgi:hypothetical protein
MKTGFGNGRGMLLHTEGLVKKTPRFRTQDDSLRIAPSCLSDIKSWMCTNMLKLNQDKTELIVFAPKHKVKSLTKLQFNFDGAILSESSCVRNLGVFFTKPFSICELLA